MESSTGRGRIGGLHRFHGMCYGDGSIMEGWEC